MYLGKQHDTQLHNDKKTTVELKVNLVHLAPYSQTLLGKMQELEEII
jgi:hypothetical protein